MNIGIIGSGELGRILAAKFASGGHSVTMANARGPASLKEFTAAIGANAGEVGSLARNKEVIIVAIPTKNIPDLPKDLFFGARKELVVVDTGNYYPSLRDGAIPALDRIGIDSQWVQDELSFPIVKAFNAILATSIRDKGRPKGDGGRVAVAVSGNDRRSKVSVFELVEELGFDPFDVGNMAQSWKQQPGSSIHCRDIGLKEIRERVGAMGDEWSVMRDRIIARRNADEIVMKADYPAYLRSLQS